jgi:hypothetical protein
LIALDKLSLDRISSKRKPSWLYELIRISFLPPENGFGIFDIRNCPLLISLLDSNYENGFDIYGER